MQSRKSIHKLTEKRDTVTLLAIESSCDDTAAAVIDNGKILANIVSSQEIHRQYGGVIPELAGRAHQQQILPVVKAALKQADIAVHDLDAVVYTRGPGLMGSLLVGSHFAKGLAMSLDIPTIGVNHLDAHVAAHYLSESPPEFPFLCLLVSGGHTQIILVKDHLNMEILGGTIDDAAGEAFDKTAKMLGLPYPGGPLIDRYAENGNPQAFKFPKARLEGLDYSFSGLKTALLYFIRKQTLDDADFIRRQMADICASMRYTIVDTLLDTFEKTMEMHRVKHIGIAGGVSANRLLRSEFCKLAEKHGIRAHIPAFEYCTDNAAMIAIAGHYKYLQGAFTPLEAVPFAR